MIRKVIIQGMANNRDKGAGKGAFSGVDPDLLAGKDEPIVPDPDLYPGVLLEASGGKVKEKNRRVD